MKVKEYDFNLPQELIAQRAVEPRDSSKLMILNSKTKEIKHKHFFNLPDFLKNGDILVINRTKVIPARIIGEKLETKAVIECFLTKRINLNTWEVLLKPAKRLKIGQKISFGNGEIIGTLEKICDDETRIMSFEYSGSFEAILEKIASMPLPPYIKEKLKDKNRYQTVYAKTGESVAAPTAGLHFTNELLDKIQKMGVTICEVYLTVGLGTFKPVKVDEIENHKMHSEEYEIPSKTANIINEAKKENRRIISVGTTTLRALESSVDKNGLLIPNKTSTNIFIYGQYNFKVVDALITNFHLPQSTLLMLVSAFGGKEYIFESYNIAIENKYRFFSFGDSMFIENKREYK